MKRSYEDWALDAVIYISLTLLAFVTLYPFLNSLAISFNEGNDTASGGITLWPRVFTWDNYAYVFRDGKMLHAFLITIARTVSGTFLSILFTSMFAYGLSRRQLIGKKFYMIVCVITMYFSGGLIPSYLLIRDLHLMNTFWVMIIPGMISVWNMIIFRTFFQGLPDGLEESAKIDGCNHLTTFFLIALPVSGPVIATLSLFTAVGHWNAWFDATLYLTNEKLQPIQVVLNQVINSTLEKDPSKEISATAQQAQASLQAVTHQSVVMATMMVATIPIMMVYPFVQKYFVKGVLVGSLKE
ncbi:carbohydrate ABC transporter permease [Paenibacillus spongiae]|uniref:Carbohydrate ABC transporter permease n=1 Tax=Paenibacillus spongiae TaxID=2909671 RepID=A0ABY5S4G4_9BACL|nr:carbohydrate ABC transporter permease [Paenibacillus spongiae]UVI28787.1 carbohydrate ABC transporter permease [Paenibacillus spongiae]